MNFNKSYRGSNIGLGLGEVLFIVFLILKLTGVINWSWWWVTAPLWISFGLTLIVIIIVSIIMAFDK